MGGCVSRCFMTVQSILPVCTAGPGTSQRVSIVQLLRKKTTTNSSLFYFQFANQEWVEVLNGTKSMLVDNYLSIWLCVHFCVTSRQGMWPESFCVEI